MFIKLVRIGRDAEMKTTNSGTQLLEVSVVYDIGYGSNKSSQWVKLAMFGARAEKLVSHFTKGTQIVATMDNVKAEAWIKEGEAKSTISAKLVDFEFTGSIQPAPVIKPSTQNAPSQHYDETSNGQHQKPQNTQQMPPPPSLVATPPFQPIVEQEDDIPF